MLKKKIACMATIVALCGTLLAGAEYTILEKTEKVESSVYGTVQTGSLASRIDNLDTLLNGKVTTNGSVENRTDTLYNDVFGTNGSDLSMLAAVNMMQWKYSGNVTHEPINDRVASLEQSIFGKVSTGSLTGRIAALRSNLLGNTKFVSEAVTVPAGTIVKLKTQNDLSSATNKKGDAVHMNVLEDVLVGNVVAIPRGAECEGTITGIRHATRFGRDGKMTITFGNVLAANGTPVALTVGNKTKEQYKRMGLAAGASAAGALVLGPVGLVGGIFVKGHDTVIPAGSTVLAETKDNSDVVGFSQVGATADTRAADLAASSVSTTDATATAPATATQAAQSDSVPAASATPQAGQIAPSEQADQEAPAPTATAAVPTTDASVQAGTNSVKVATETPKATGVDLSKASNDDSPSAVVTISKNQ